MIGRGPSDNFDRTLGQRRQKRAAVRLGYDPVVQNDDDPAIAFCADEAADALSKFQDRFRQRIFRERIAAALLH